MKDQKKIAMIRLAFISASISFCLVTNAVCAERVALVIGNSTYAGADALTTPVEDAKAMAQTLEMAGFEVIRSENASLAQIDEALLSFAAKAKTAKTAWFFFAGRSIQAKGKNYLVPVDAQVKEEAKIRYLTVSLSQVLSAMNRAGTPLKVVVLDCSRENSFAAELGPNVLPGLGAVEAPENTIVAYAAAPGEVAKDGDGPNSHYTKAMVATLKKEGLDLAEVFEKAGKAVGSATGNKQQPWLASRYEQPLVVMEEGAVARYKPPVSPPPAPAVAPVPVPAITTPPAVTSTTTPPKTGLGGAMPASKPLPAVPPTVATTSPPKTGLGGTMPVTTPVPAVLPTVATTTPPKTGLGGTMPVTTPVPAVPPTVATTTPPKTGLGGTMPVTTPVPAVPPVPIPAPMPTAPTQQKPKLLSITPAKPSTTTTPVAPIPAPVPATTGMKIGSQKSVTPSTPPSPGQPDFANFGYYKNSQVFKDGPFETVSSVTVHGGLVKEVQRLLLAKGKDSGWMNSETQNAILKLQKDRGIPATGLIDYQTAGILKLKMPKAATPGAYSANKPAPGKSSGKSGNTIPSGTNVPGRPGLVYSPYSPGKPIDAGGRKAGEPVTDPHSKQVFLLPSNFQPGRANAYSNTRSRKKGTIIPGKSYNSLNGTTTEGFSGVPILPVGTVHEETLKKLGIRRR